MKTIYLAGPMDYCSKEQATSWRDYVHNQLLSTGRCEILDPTRRGFGVLDVNEIVESDKEDLDLADYILANILDVKMVGTHFELMYCWDRNKPAIVVYHDPKELSPWIKYHCARIFRTMPEAVNYIKTLI